MQQLIILSFCRSEIQLKSPNWLFGQRKYDDSNSASKVSTHAVSNGALNGENEVDGLGDLSWISAVPDLNQEDIFERYFTLINFSCVPSYCVSQLLSCGDSSLSMPCPCRVLQTPFGESDMHPLTLLKIPSNIAQFSFSCCTSNNNIPV